MIIFGLLLASSYRLIRSINSPDISLNFWKGLYSINREKILRIVIDWLMPEGLLEVHNKLNSKKRYQFWIFGLAKVFKYFVDKF